MSYKNLLKFLTITDRQKKLIEGELNNAIDQRSQAKIDAIPPSGGVQSASGVITSAQILTGWDTPIEVLPAPGAGKVYLVKDGYWIRNKNTTRYDATQDGVFLYIGDEQIAGRADHLSNAIDLYGYSYYSGLVSNNLINQNLYFQFGTNANPFGGDDDMKYYIEYSIVDFDAIT